MAKKISKAEFAKLAGIESRQVSIYASRGKIAVEKGRGGKVDIELDINRAFLSSRGASIKPIEQKLKTVSVKEKKKIQKDQNTLVDLQVIEKKQRLEIDRLALEEKKLKIEKLRGQLIPTDLVYSVITVLSDAQKMAYKDAIEVLNIRYKEKYEMNSEDLAHVRKYMNDVINRANENAVREAKRSVEVIVNEYSQKRGRGERIN